MPNTRRATATTAPRLDDQHRAAPRTLRTEARPPRAAARPRVLGLGLAGLIGAAACLGACATDGGATTTEASGASGSAPATPGSAARRGPAPTAEQLDAQMIFGPTAARALGYRIDWEAGSVVGAGREFARFFVDDDSIFTLDNRNLLSRLRVADGIRLWQTPVTGPVDEVLGINRLVDSDSDLVFVTVEGSIFVVDATTGGIIERQRLGRTASTAPTAVGRMLVYGGRTGEIVWHDAIVGHSWRVTGLEGSIRSAPQLVGNDIVAASTAGVVGALDAGSARTMWTRTLLAGISTRPAAGNDVVFVSGLDQYLRALSLRDGRTLWQHFTDAPLTTSPMLVGERLYQRLPSEGLACFEAFPTDAPRGRRIWTNAEVRGEVIGRKGRTLLVWDAPGRVLSALDDRGALVAAVELPRVSELALGETVDGDLFVASRDGRLQRLVPQ